MIWVFALASIWMLAYAGYGFALFVVEIAGIVLITVREVRRGRREERATKLALAQLREAEFNWHVDRCPGCHASSTPSGRTVGPEQLCFEGVALYIKYAEARRRA